MEQGVISESYAEAVQRLMNELRSYNPWNEQEERDREEILRQLEHSADIFTRENRSAHMTASSWILNPLRNRILMIYHNIYNSWSWTGGHADGDTDLLGVAIREAKEETGITHIRPLSKEIFSLEILTVDGHVKRGKYVSSHLHLNMTYLLEADDQDELHRKADENSSVSWFSREDAIRMCTEPWMAARIYTKLNEKLQCME